ncbi:MAG: cytochrome c [Pseudomonadota bacterium]|nr:cytochrome c [Pseudomonadota bacterium]
MKALAALIVLALIGAGAFWRLSAPSRLDPSIAAEMDKPGDAHNGAVVFWIAGCAACHAKSADEPLKLGGGKELETPFGPITPPNISPDPEDGIGNWSAQKFARAIYDGVDDEGEHLYPAFPYPSYRRMSVADVRDLWAFLRGLPKVRGESPPPGFGFPFNIRRTIGVWKWLYLTRATPPEAVAVADTADYGRYLVQGPGHCGECHTPRDFLGGPNADKALTGARMPDGKGKSHDITPLGLEAWTQSDIELALTTGITPDGDSLGGAMAEVVRNLSRLPKANITAIARYLKAGR